MPRRLEPLVIAPEIPATRPHPRAAAPATTALSVIVVNYRRPDESISLCEQLDHSDAVRSGMAEVVVVDNDANPKTLRHWAAGRAGISVHSLGCNRGFARAVNEGCQASHGQWLLLLNPDMHVPDEFVDKVLVAAEQIAEKDPNVGVIGFELRHADGTPQPSAGPFPTLANVVGGMIRSRPTRRCRIKSSEAAAVPWVTGCCLLVRRSCWMELNGFDEDFFLYYEDVDLCRRARAIGWTVWFEPALQVRHDHPLHLRSVPAPMRLITRHALLTYAAKHWPKWQFRLLGRVVRSEARLRGLWSRIRGRVADAEHFFRLQRLVDDLIRSRSVRARAVLLAAARSLTVDSLP
ncbi:MAG: glycosyltransferase family 2 protein [Gemmataceae bacterium]